MAATTESDLFMLSTQYLAEPFGLFLQDGSGYNQCSFELEELEKRLFLENDLHLEDFRGEGVFLPQPEDQLDEVENKTAVFPTISSSNPPGITRKLSVSEELNSLSLDQFSQHIGVNSSSTPPTTPHSNKRVSSSPLTSPKKQQVSTTQQALVDSKEGIRRSLFTADEFSAMGLVFGGIGDVGHAPPSNSAAARPYVMHRSLSSHSLGQLRGSSSASALDSTMQGLHSCTGSIVPSLTQLLEVKEGDGIEMEIRNRGSSRTSSSGFSPACSGSSSSIRRVCSTGDIQRMNSLQPDGQEEGGFKIGRYSLAERKERIHRYRQKRSERNFNKKIKYACRKTLADSRPRVRGRFAKNEDVLDSSSSAVLQPRQTTRLKSDAAAAAEVEDQEVDALLEDDESLINFESQSSGELSECWGIALDGR